jgi:3-oxoacyl-[acyl-carrier protein] reductase
MFELTDRVAVITGAASGIGAATARSFARAGANVVLGWYPPDGHDVEPVRADVEAAGQTALAHVVDVTSTESVDACVARAIDRFGRLDVVVANAGIARTVPTLDLTDAAWQAVLDVNLHGAWRCFRAALPHMIRASYGRLLVASSIAGNVHAWPEHLNYSASKAAVVGMIRTLAVEFGRHGITANAIAPGTVVSPQSLDPVNSMGPDGVALAGRNNPVGRGGTAEDIAAFYTFLASPEAGFMNGQMLVVDGGRSLLNNDF